MIFGGAGNDVIFVLTEAARANGDAGNDTITGSSGEDSMGGGTGTNTLIGGAQSDIYFVDSSADVIVELVTDLGPLDSVVATVSYTLGAGVLVESLAALAGTATNLVLTGNALSQTIIGNLGNNALDTGGGAADALSGGFGDDTYLVFNAGDTINELAGQGAADRVLAAVSFVLAADDDIEILETSNFALTTNLNLTGNALSQNITGNAGDNILEDTAGAADTLHGGAGNDIYVLRTAGTIIDEGIGQGTADRVAVARSFSLAGDDNIEIITTTSFAGISAINLSGNAFAQSMTGNAGDNRMDGRGGFDTLDGGAGADVFMFTSAVTAGNLARINNYVVLDDRIEIDDAYFTGLLADGQTLNTQAFAANALGLAVRATDRIIYETDTGFLFFDQDGVGGATATQFAILAPNLALGAAEFLVI